MGRLDQPVSRRSVVEAGLARAAHPAFISFDGDVVVVPARGGQEASDDTVGTIDAESVADAIHDAVRRATTPGDVLDLRTPGVRSPDDPVWSPG